MTRKLFIACISFFLMACASKSDITSSPQSEVIERYFVGGFIKVTIEEEILKSICLFSPVLINTTLSFVDISPSTDIV